MKTTRLILKMTHEEMNALLESVNFSIRAVTDSPDTPEELKKTKGAALNAILAKLPRS
jgi:hypothetical protein